MKYIFTTLLIYVFIASSSQDKIIRLNNSVINCKIISITNDTIYFVINKNGDSFNSKINQDAVIKIKIGENSKIHVNDDITYVNKNKIFHHIIYSDIEPNKIPNRGFFIGGGLTSLYIDGNIDIMSNHSLVTDKIIVFTYDLYNPESNFDIVHKGLGWKNKFLIGFKPIIGYKFSSFFSILGSWDYYLNKTSKQTDSWYSSKIPDFGVSITDDSKFSQNTFQILGQLNILKSKTVFITTGFELVKMKAEINMIERFPNEVIDYRWKAEGANTGLGMVFGGGVKLPIFNRDLCFFGSVMYNLTKIYNGKLLVVTSIPNREINLNAKMDVSGINLSIGIKKYFNRKWIKK